MRLALRLVLPLALVGGLLWLGADQISQVSLPDLSQRLSALSASQWICGLAATLVAYLAAAAQERAIVAHLGLRPEPRRARAAALATAAVAQTVGFGPVVGAIVRRRLLPSLSAAQSFAISAGITLAFFTGLAFLATAAAAFGPETGYRGEARAALMAALLVGVALCTFGGSTVLGLRKPVGLTFLRLGLWISLDCLALCVVFWCLLPPTTRPEFLTLLPVFLLGLGMGLISGCPAGAGPFEATMALELPGLETHDLLASLLAFRFLAYALPACCGGGWALIGPSLLGREPESTLTEVASLPEEQLRALPWAEAQLVRQGDLHMVGAREGMLWVSKPLGLSRLFLGQPLVSSGTKGLNQESLAAARDLADREALAPLLYKVGPRLAAAARSAGWAVLPIAREAVLNPGSFTTSGRDVARLRRKLRCAEKAGLAVEWPSNLPIAEMESVSDAWVQRRGGERGLSMGRWAPDYVRGQKVVLARNASDQIVAFATFHAGADEWTLDLMRSADEAPDGALYLLVAAAIRQAAMEGIAQLSLAAVPVETFGLTGGLERWARRLAAPSRGLAQFKEAFAPKWEPRYIAAPSRTRLVLGAAELAWAVRAKPVRRTQ